MHVTPMSVDWDRGRLELVGDPACSDPRRRYVVVQLERMLGLPVPDKTPVTTSSSIGPRVLAAFLARTALESERWVVGCGTGMDDDDVASNTSLFEAMPAVAFDILMHSPAGHPWDLVESRYWFLARLKGHERNHPWQRST